MKNIFCLHNKQKKIKDRKCIFSEEKKYKTNSIINPSSIFMKGMMQCNVTNKKWKMFCYMIYHGMKDNIVAGQVLSMNILLTDSLLSRKRPFFAFLQLH